MTMNRREPLLRSGRIYDPDAYWRRPSVWCADCGREFSDAVGPLHASRTGHALKRLPAVLERAA